MDFSNRLKSSATPASDYPIIGIGIGIGIGDIMALTDGATQERGICTAITIQVTAPGMARCHGPEITK